MILLSFLRSLIMGILFIPFTALWSFMAFATSFFIRDPVWPEWVMSTWGRIGMKMFGVKLEVKGLENIPAGKGLFIFNHTSFFDIFAMEAAYRKFRFGAKIELFRIPLFGPAMRRFGVLPIARTNREEVFKVYEEASKRAQRGEKFALSPEGKRNAHESLLPFKAGPFIFAINSGMPILPVVIKGAHAVLGKGRILPNWDRWSRTITVEYLPPIPIEGHTLDERNLLQEKSYQAMREHLPASN